jgi:hypothetical protein
MEAKYALDSVLTRQRHAPRLATQVVIYNDAGWAGEQMDTPSHFLNINDSILAIGRLSHTRLSRKPSSVRRPARFVHVATGILTNRSRT